jgi:hypothetical protein
LPAASLVPVVMRAGISGTALVRSDCETIPASGPGPVARVLTVLDPATAARRRPVPCCSVLLEWS